MSKSRRARGTGTIFHSAHHGCWIGRVTVAGVRCEVRGATQGEVVRKLALARPPAPTATLAEWATRWLAGLSVRPSTRRSYTRSLEKCVVPALGTTPLAKLTAYHLEELSRKWLAANVRPGTVRLRLDHVRTCLSAAVRAGVLTENVAAVAQRPRMPRREFVPFSPDELTRLIAAASEQPLTRIFALLAAVGCRVGEAVALNVPDVDFAAGTVAITKTQDDTLNTPGPPKSANGVRTIRVPTIAQAALRDAAGERKTGPLFRAASGKRVLYRVLANQWAPFLARVGLDKPPRTIHALRHSVGTALVSAGVPLGDVAAFLGDAVETVVKHYLHPAGTDPAVTLERLYGGGKVDSGTG